MDRHHQSSQFDALVTASHPALAYSILLNIPINYHPMALLPSIASIADLFTRPLPTISHHRYTHLVIGDTTPITPSTLVARATTTVVASAVDSVTAASAAVDSVPTATLSDSVPTLHPTSVPLVLDTGASGPVPRSCSDFPLEIAQASYGLIRSPISVVSKALASTPVDPYTLITGEDAIDLSSSDLSALNSDSVETVSSFTKVSFDIRQFGTASLTFIFSPNLDLIKVFVTPTQVDWIHWVPLPRLTPTESYFHIFGRDYLQAITLFHLIPIWIYFLLHFAVNLED